MMEVWCIKWSRGQRLVQNSLGRVEHAKETQLRYSPRLSLKQLFGVHDTSPPRALKLSKALRSLHPPTVDIELEATYLSMRGLGMRKQRAHTCTHSRLLALLSDSSGTITMHHPSSLADLGRQRFLPPLAIRLAHVAGTLETLSEGVRLL